MSIPWSLRKTVTKPTVLMVAMKAKASATPPNWARTPDADMMDRRNRPLGLPVTTAYARTAPKNAPATALTADTDRLSENAFTMYGLLIPAKFVSEKPPPGAVIDPTKTIAVGRSRNRPTKTKKGITPSHERDIRRSPVAGRAAVLIAGVSRDAAFRF